MSFRVIEKCYNLREDGADGGYALDGVKVLGTYETEEKASKAAVEARDRNCYFDDWEEIMEQQRPSDSVDELPFCSWEIENPDNDEGYVIDVEDMAEKENLNKKEIANILQQEEKLSTRKKRKVTKSLEASNSPMLPRVFGKCAIGIDRHDSNIFIRNPSRLISRAVKLAPSAFPGGSSKTGFVDLCRRISNAFYSCKGVACDGSGVQFALKKVRNVSFPSLVWIPPPGSDLNGQSADSTIVDTMHTDLIDSKTGSPRAKPNDIQSWCSPVTKHLMLNKFSEYSSISSKEYDVVAEAIRACSSLQTFVANDWLDVPASIFDALGSPHLRGVHMMSSDVQDQAVHDAIVKMLKRSPNLVWLGLDFLGELGFEFTQEIFRALPASLEVLFIDGPHDKLDLTKLSQQLPNLKLRLVFPDKKFNSM